MPKIPNYDDNFESYEMEEMGEEMGDHYQVDDLYEGIAEDAEPFDDDEGEDFPARDDNRDDYTGLTKEDQWD